MISRILLSILALFSLSRCAPESIDLAGGWEGTANLVVDGVRKQTPLKLELEQNGPVLGGALVWGEYRRAITSGSAKGPVVELESVASTDRLHLRALFRKDALEGRFWIQYAQDPEPFPGTFLVTRKQ
jgi:hypothetical protein